MVRRAALGASARGGAAGAAQFRRRRQPRTANAVDDAEQPHPTPPATPRPRRGDRRDDRGTAKGCRDDERCPDRSSAGGGRRDGHCCGRGLGLDHGGRCRATRAGGGRWGGPGRAEHERVSGRAARGHLDSRARRPDRQRDPALAGRRVGDHQRPRGRLPRLDPRERHGFGYHRNRRRSRFRAVRPIE